MIRDTVDCRVHKFVVNAHRYISTSDLALGQLGVDKRLGLGMFHADR